MRQHFDLVVTRHQGLLDFLQKEGFTWDEVASHVTDPSVLDGKEVLGFLTLELAAHCASVTAPIMEVPAELRGTELSEELTREYCRGFKRYAVVELL